MPSLSQLQQGDSVVEETLVFTRDSLVRYAGASLDFNPIHYRDDVATSVGLDGVLAHGMLTMGAAVGPVTRWLGADGWVVDYQSRFTKPVPVPAQGEACVAVTATVAKLFPEEGRARIDLTVTLGDQRVLGKSQVLIQFAESAA